jgi:hypothetical protein
MVHSCAKRSLEISGPTTVLFFACLFSSLSIPSGSFSGYLREVRVRYIMVLFTVYKKISCSFRTFFGDSRYVI